MAYDEGVAERLGEVFENIPFSSEKKMFGSLGFLSITCQFAGT